MFCPNCGKETADNVKFCSSCGMEFATNTQPEATPTPPPAPVAGGRIVAHEIVQEKKWAMPEKVLSVLSVFTVLYSVVGPILGSLFFGMSGGFLNILRGILIAGALFGVAMFIHSKRPLSDHYKFKCPYCDQEDTVATDEKSTFNCSKCKKTMTIVDGQIKTID
ncbi:MAG: zinc ribbon domain-containing protein [Clostridia bacterium]|nr:zinc ribbon domain-containing protein [Clostridia bacterium]